MKVIDYLKMHGVEKLKDEYGVIVKDYPEGLLVFNYDQINSPKNEITNECRGLILDTKFNVVSRSFDRFFNLGEMGTTFNPVKSRIYSKIDGSLIKIYNWKGIWYVSTRGTAFAESKVNGWDITFEEMVFKSLRVSDKQSFQKRCETLLDPEITYICEITGIENRVVTRYAGYTLWLLAERNNLSGKYSDECHHTSNILFGFEFPDKFNFTTIEECVNSAKALPDLKEGYVVYENGVPVCKVKSPAYVAVHHIRGEGLNPKRIAELVVINEQDEYLKYFPEDEKHFTPYMEELHHALLLAERVYQDAHEIEDQKQFALEVKDYPFDFILFKARKEKQNDIKKVFNSLDTNLKVKFLLGLMRSEKDA